MDEKTHHHHTDSHTHIETTLDKNSRKTEFIFELIFLIIGLIIISLLFYLCSGASDYNSYIAGELMLIMFGISILLAFVIYAAIVIGEKR